MAKTLHPGDQVKWSTAQGETEGKVVKKLTRASKIESHAVKASKSDPEYLVKSDKSGRTAAHKPDALKRPEPHRAPHYRYYGANAGDTKAVLC